MKEVREWLPEADLSNLRLHPAAHHAIEIEQPEGGTDKRGQFVLPVSRPEQNADDLFEQAQVAEETGEIAEAERLYRVLMKCDPTDAAPPFNLGNTSVLTPDETRRPSLPVKIELVVIKTAKALGLEISPTLLARRWPNPSSGFHAIAATSSVPSFSGGDELFWRDTQGAT